MMKAMFRTCILCLALIGLFAGQAVAQNKADAKEGLYASFGGLFSMQGDLENIDVKKGLGFNAAAGNRFRKLRAELELGYRSGNIAEQLATAGVDVDLTTWSFMANGYFDAPVQQNLKVYFGAGVGLATTKVKGTVISEGDTYTGSASDNAFAYQLMAGVSYSLGDGIQLFGGYRFMGTSWESLDYQTHNIEAGLRFGF